MVRLGFVGDVFVVFGDINCQVFMEIGEDFLLGVFFAKFWCFVGSIWCVLGFEMSGWPVFFGSNIVFFETPVALLKGFRGIIVLLSWEFF